MSLPHYVQKQVGEDEWETIRRGGEEELSEADAFLYGRAQTIVTNTRHRVIAIAYDFDPATTHL